MIFAVCFPFQMSSVIFAVSSSRPPLRLLPPHRRAPRLRQVPPTVWPEDPTAARRRFDHAFDRIPRSGEGRPSPPPTSRTNWTRLVPPSVLTGHVSSLLTGTSRATRSSSRTVTPSRNLSRTPAGSPTTPCMTVCGPARRTLRDNFRELSRELEKLGRCDRSGPFSRP
jgi:hypothetical protein